MNVVLLNQRNCGVYPTPVRRPVPLRPHHDARFVIDELARVDGITAVAAAGYSLGGNLALKLAGEYGDAPPPSLRAVAAVSPILEISECVRALERRGNFLYQWNFVRDLKARMRRKDPGSSRPVRSLEAQDDPDGARFRRCLHGAAFRLRWSGGLLPSSQRNAGD